MGVSVWENKWCKNYLKIFSFFASIATPMPASLWIQFILSALFIVFVQFAEVQSDVCSLCLQMWVCSSGSRARPLLCWQQHLLRERVMSLSPHTETKDSNYHLQTALSSAPWLMLQLTPKHQKAGPGSSHLMCCKSSPVNILFPCDITVQFWNLYLQTLISVK